MRVPKLVEFASRLIPLPCHAVVLWLRAPEPALPRSVNKKRRRRAADCLSAPRRSLRVSSNNLWLPFFLRWDRLMDASSQFLFDGSQLRPHAVTQDFRFISISPARLAADEGL